MFLRKPSEPAPPLPKVALSVWTTELVEKFRKADYHMVKLTSLTDHVLFWPTPAREMHHGYICKGQVLHFYEEPMTCYLSLNASLKGDKPTADLGSLNSELSVCVDSNDQALFAKLVEAFEWAALSRRPYVYVSLHNKNSRGKASMKFLLDNIYVYSSIDLVPDIPF